MEPAAVAAEFARRQREGWSGKIEADFKDGKFVLRIKPPRGEKQGNRVD